MDDLVGDWDSIDSSEDWVPSMVVTEEGEITITRSTVHSSGHEMNIKCRSDIGKVQLIESVFIVPCRNTNTLSFNFVFSGWVRNGVIQIVGMLYTIDYGKPIKGVHIAMERREATDNKSLNADASDAGAG